ncbi:MAG TPA: nickel pincer cofactor biosynthesis protein LarC [Vicinamibacterales bacterium]|nr:nickel pincer cofactor biosynthesis protein LarC [Vicinamibacterales bacterium]
MARVLYFDCFSGISGDMTLGALLDAGLPLDELKRAIGSLALPGVHIHADRVLRTGVSATKFTVHAHEHDGAHDHGASAHARDHAPEPPHTHAHGEGHGHSHGAGDGHRTLPEIFELIDRSALSTSGRDRARTLFDRLAQAEAAIHQMPVERVHLHEVGAIDSIIDIVGAVFAMEWVAADRIVCSPLNVGGGMVRSAHGVFPVPAPATVRLLGDAPIYAGAVQQELVTPTGALLATAYAHEFGPLPAMSVEHVGYGAGDRDDGATPNVLRVLIGRSAAEAGVKGDRVTVVECEIDDMNPQIFGVVMDLLYAAGALEVFYVPAQMKKNRPGTLLTVVCRPALRRTVADILFRETTTIGLRHYDVDRECLDREIVSVQTPLGPVRFKVASRDGHVTNAVPEFDDCAKLAAAHQVSVKDVQAMAIKAYRS